jgi:hypothetical protein
MEFIKKLFSVIFKTEFLKKILLITSILVLFNYLDKGLRIDIDNSISSGYGGIDINIKENK